MSSSTHTSATVPTPPVAKKVPTVRTHHGREFHDDYEWLRDKGNAETTAYLEAENEYTEARTEHLAPVRDAIFNEIKSRVQETDMSVPVRCDGYWYYGRTIEGKSYGVSCRLPVAEAAKLVPAEPESPADKTNPEWAPPQITQDSRPEGEEILLDCNELAEGHEFFSLGASSVTTTGNFLAYSTDVCGDERFNLRIKDLRTGELLPDEINNIAYGATWVGEEWLFYQRVDDAWRPHEVWRHRVGTPTEDDVCIFREDDEHFWVGIDTTRSEKYLIIGVGSKITSECYYIDVEADPCGEPQLVLARESGIEYDIDHAIIGGRDYWLIVHNKHGVDSELSLAPAGPLSSLDDATIIVPHEAGQRIEGVDIFSTHVVMGYRKGGIGRVALMLIGEELGPVRPIEFPEELYSAGAGGNPEWETPYIRMGYGSFTTPSTVYDYEVATGRLIERKQQVVLGDFDPDQYEARRLWSTARDGELIPVSLVYRKDCDFSQPQPMMLYGYGSYEHSVDPGFSIARLSLLDRGMVCAFAHVRGGGEMGRTWYEGGKTTTKKNTFTDFIDVADDLISRNFTASDRLVAVGGSAGGLLMGAVANMGGDRFSGIEAVVPFVDPLTSMLMPELPLTVTEWDEWGDPLHDADVYDYMASYAPYENIDPENTYPPILALTSVNDTRVLYVEPAKWVAKLRALVPTIDVCLKTEMVAGHGGVSGRYEKWKETAFEYAWICDRAGVATVSTDQD